MADTRLIAADEWLDQQSEEVLRFVETFVIAEREACMADVCPRCRKGEPICDADQCMTMGHFERVHTCHPFSRDKAGRVTTHIACLSAGIRFRAA